MWQKIKDKISAPPQAARPEDWAAMRKQLDGHPHLGQRRGIYGYRVGLILVLLGFVLIWYYWAGNKPLPAVERPLYVPDRQIAPDVDQSGPRGDQVAKEGQVEGQWGAAEASQGEAGDLRGPESNPGSGHASSASSINQQGEVKAAGASGRVQTTRARTNRGKQVFRESAKAGKAERKHLTHLSPKSFNWLKPDLARDGLNLYPSAEERSAWNPPAMAWRFEGLGLFGGLYPFLKAPSGYAFSVQGEARWVRKRWSLNLALQHQMQRIQQGQDESKEDYWLNTSQDWLISWATVWDNRPVWVVTGPNQGRWINDSVEALAVDSSLVTRVDTQKVRSTEMRRWVEESQSFNLPLWAGYRWYHQRWALELGVGTVLHYRQQHGASAEGPATQESWQGSFLLQPELSYSLNHHWQLGLRWQSQWQIWGPSEQAQRQGWLLGLRYRW